MKAVKHSRIRNGSSWPSQSHPFPLKGEAVMVNPRQQAISIRLSPILHQRLRGYCQANGSREQEIVERAIREWLEREEALEQCCQSWQALLSGELDRL